MPGPRRADRCSTAARPACSSCSASATRRTASRSASTGRAATRGPGSRSSTRFPASARRGKRALIRHFGSAERLLEATRDELEGVPGRAAEGRAARSTPRCTRPAARDGRAPDRDRAAAPAGEDGGRPVVHVPAALRSGRDALRRRRPAVGARRGASAPGEAHRAPAGPWIQSLACSRACQRRADRRLRSHAPRRGAGGRGRIPLRSRSVGSRLRDRGGRGRPCATASTSSGSTRSWLLRTQTTLPRGV